MEIIHLKELIKELYEGSNTIIQIKEGLKDVKHSRIYKKRDIGSDLYTLLNEIAMLDIEKKMVLNRLDPHYKIFINKGN